MTCRWCRNFFVARADARFCSVACRVAAHRAMPPEEMINANRWLRHEAKRPITVAGASGSSTNSVTWSDWVSAQDSMAGDGLGFALGDGFSCIDLDHCFENGELASWAVPIVAAARGTFMEISISGNGLHIFGTGFFGRGRRIGNVEVYSEGRFMTVSLRRFRRSPLRLLDLSPAVAVALAGAE